MPIWWIVEEWLLFGVCVVEDAQLVPEEERKDSVGAKSEVGGSDTLVYAKNALCPNGLQQNIQDSPVHEALRARESIGKELIRVYQRSHLCRLPFRLSHLHPAICFSPPTSFPCLPVPRALPYLALSICRLVVEPCADNIKRCHGQDHCKATHHRGRQSQLPALRRKYLRE